MSHTVSRADRLEALRVRALARDARRAKRWVALADAPTTRNPWTGKPPKGTADRIDDARRLVRQSHNTHARIARAAWDESHAA